MGDVVGVVVVVVVLLGGWIRTAEPGRGAGRAGAMGGILDGLSGSSSIVRRSNISSSGLTRFPRVVDGLL
jgi:hypothetical protein